MALSEFGKAAKLEFARGWKTLIATFIGMGSGIGIFAFVSSLFITPLEETFGWSRAAISASMIAIPVSALFLPFIGSLIDRIGAAKVVGFSVITCSVAYALLATIGGELWQYYAIYMLVVLFGAATGAIGYSRVIVSWFEHARGLALAVALAGSGLGAALASPIISWSIAEFGFRGGYLTLSAICLIGGICALLLGLGKGPIEQSVESEGGSKHTIREAASTRTFWLIGAAVFVTALPVVGFSNHIQPIFVSLGLSSDAAGLLIPVLAISVLVGRLLTGVLLDIFWAPAVAGCICLLAAFGSALLLFAGDILWVSVFGTILLGATQGAELDLLGYLTAKYFGIRAYARVYGALFICFAFSIPIGSVMFGAVFDATAAYTNAFIISTGLLIVASILYFSLAPYPVRYKALSTATE